MSLMVGKPAIRCFGAIEKRHIAAALLLCPEDGTGAVQLSVVLFLAGNNGCSNGCTTADKHILPSEKAKAYEMKLEAIRRKAGRPSKENSRQVVGDFESADLVGQASGESGRQVQRFIRLNKLTPELMKMVDDGKLKTTPAVELSYLTPEEQEDFLSYMESEGCTPSLSQAQKLKEASKESVLTSEKIQHIMAAKPPSVKPRDPQLMIPVAKVERYFPKGFTSDQMQQVIVKLLENYARVHQHGSR